MKSTQRLFREVLDDSYDNDSEGLPKEVYEDTYAAGMALAIISLRSLGYTIEKKENEDV